MMRLRGLLNSVAIWKRKDPSGSGLIRQDWGVIGPGRVGGLVGSLLWGGSRAAGQGGVPAGPAAESWFCSASSACASDARAHRLSCLSYAAFT